LRTIYKQATLKTFSELGVEPNILKALDELGFEHPMPVQAEVLPILLHTNTDIVTLAQTGTGKTAAFGIPCIQKLGTGNKHTEVLILCPTRELCVQITNDLKNFSKYVPDATTLAVYGGASIETQKRTLHKGAKIIVATPGRMVDLTKRGYADLSHVHTVVLDEADEMLNMGFKDDLDFILSKTPADKNTLLFSATMPLDGERIARNYMHDPKEVTVGSKNSGSKNVHHYYYLVQARDRYQALKRIADYYPNIYSIVFCRTRAETQDVADMLVKDGYSADALHGDLSQSQRDAVMRRFRGRNLQMLVATDVAARGLDVNDLTHVINYNLPDEVDQYTHRSGRTGRADKTGISISIINLKEKHKIKRTEKIIGQQFTQAKVPTGKEICEKQLFNIIENIESIDVQNEEIKEYLPIIMKKMEGLSKEDLVSRLLSVEFNRFLAYYKQTPDLNVDEFGSSESHEGRRKERRESAPHGGDRRGREEDGNYTRLFFNTGRKERVEPPQIIQLIHKGAGKHGIDIGRIDIYDGFTYADVDTQYAEEILGNLNGLNFRGRALRVDVATPRDQEERREKRHSFGGKKKPFDKKKQGFEGKPKKKKRY
jgi:ATP-dependent RNA helicase DeaD